MVINMTEQNKVEKEPLPVDETLQVKDYDTIYKTKKWWCAVALVNAFGHDKVMVYLWQWKESKKQEGGTWVGTGNFKWKVQQKMGINFAANWEMERASIDKFMAKISEVRA
jgi:hypothetical protein